MSEGTHSGELPDEALGGGLLDEAIIEPIDPDRPGEAAATALAKLVVAARPEKNKIKSGVVAEVFAAIQILDRPDANADELNNLGCAWALLAYNEARLDYWRRARTALEESRKHEDASDAQKERAKKNLDYVVAARKAMESL